MTASSSPRWNTPVVADAADVAVHLLDDWIDRLGLFPHLAFHGSGGRRRWTTEEAVAVAVCARLREAGLRLPAAIRLAHAIRGSLPPSSGADATLFVVPLRLGGGVSRSSWAVASADFAADLFGHPFLALPLGALRAEVEGRLAERTGRAA